MIKQLQTFDTSQYMVYRPNQSISTSDYVLGRYILTRSKPYVDLKKLKFHIYTSKTKCNSNTTINGCFDTPI